MARVLGESGGYVSREAVRQRHQTVTVVMIVVAVAGFIEGMTVSSYIPRWLLRPAWTGLFSIITLVGLWLISKWGSRRLDELEKKRNAFMRGANGEAAVGALLSELPDSYCVINDLSTPFGNLDHVAIGPTGVFIVDAKNWRGVVAADGRGELLLNNQPTEKRLIRPFVARMLKVKEKVRTLAPEVDPFYEALFVFTAARVEAKWGRTGSVNCLTDDNLNSYIVEKDFGKKLGPEDVERLGQAFLALARMDKEFAAAPELQVPKEAPLVAA